MACCTKSDSSSTSLVVQFIKQLVKSLRVFFDRGPRLMRTATKLKEFQREMLTTSKAFRANSRKSFA